MKINAHVTSLIGLPITIALKLARLVKGVDVIIYLA